MDSRKPLDIRAISLMLLICFIWAIQQIGLKATEPLAGPVLQIGIRSGVAALCVWLLVRFRGGHIAFTGRTAAMGALAGLIFGIEFLMVGAALEHTTASHVVVFMYTAPIFAGLGLHWKLPSERLASMQWLGIGLAACGIAIAFLGREGMAAEGVTLRGDLMALLAGALWGSTTVLIRSTSLSRIPATHTLFYQLVGAFAILVGTAVLTGKADIVPTVALFAHLAFQSLVVAFFSFLIWFWLLTKYMASALGVFSFITPLFGVTLGVLLLGDPLTPPFLAGAAAVIAGILMVSAWPWVRMKLARSS
ncbi:DMT family transporter [Ciceribacter sp. L1K23]|uniref:DMT family transporter n=1 Tax=Ciceribacter sp. L1K23 TaxID=2820276 RepID=UPI001B844678|nr:DMT family transporter [Ciceribacter sp. L1K23]MBR0556311.1 DMT family transporter [Ciceribacter sp. L1K23]